MKSEQISPFIKITFAVVVWGASFIATKVALRDVSPITVVWLRFLMGVVILGVAVLIRRQFERPTLKELIYFGLLGFLGITFHQWLQSTGLVTAKASTTAWIVATTPIFIVLLGWLILREGLVWWQILGIGLATAGVLLVVTEGDLAKLAVGGFGAPGDVLILISALNWAIFSVLSRWGLKRHSAANMMFFVMGFGWIFISVLFLADSGLLEIRHLSREGWFGVSFLGIFCSGFAYIFWYDALQAVPASQVGVFLYLEPLVAIVVASWLLGESIIFTSVLGGGVILFGVWLVNRSTSK